MQIVPNLDFTTVSPTQSGLDKFVQMISKVYRNFATAFNGNIGFGTGTQSDNINGVWKTVTFAVANTNVTIVHNLNRIPVGYIVMTKSQAGDVFTGSITSTKTQITLQCSVAGTTVSLFIV